MHCYICDKEMSDSEIQWDIRYSTWDPCSSCLVIISETFGEEGDEEEEIVYDDETCYENLFPVEINDLV